ncbi:MAG: biliverdin-producing heme oxygenase [Corynebacterium glucuronolyticum]|nr:biliverdin-producing heme oxygenase [Corynebacterium glucuronolyticum]
MTTTVPVQNSISGNENCLSLQLKKRTERAHDNAEQSQFMSLLIGGDLEATDVIRLHSQYWVFYSALESVMRRSLGDAGVANMYDPRLERTSCLEHDLQFALGDGWKNELEIVAATRDYAEYLRSIEDAASYRIIAHHYVRYLGDLSGGQVIFRKLVGDYGFDPAGLTFYRFEGIDKLPPFRARFRKRLDSIELSLEKRDSLLQEAEKAFDYNLAIFNQLCS